MADIALRLRQEGFDEAAARFKELAESSENVGNKVQQFQEKFKTENIDKFIERNKLAGIAVGATAGSLAGMQKEAAGLEREIQRLIKSGLDPNSKEIKKLQGEYFKLQGEIDKSTEASKRKESTLKNMIKSIASVAAAYVSWRAVTGFLKQTTTELATLGDELAKSSRRMGVSVESLQELRFAAERSGVSTQELTSSLEQMTKRTGEAMNGTGALTTHLRNSNPALLEQVKNVKNSEEAFNLLTTAIAETKNPMEKAALATAAFGRSGQGIITMTENGAEGLAQLRAEAQKYGNVMSTDAANAAERFKDAQENLTQVFKGFIMQIGVPLLTPLAEAMQAFAEWASEGDRIENIIDTIMTLLKIAIPAFAAYIVYVKGGAAATAALAAAQKIYASATVLLANGLSVATIKQWALNVAMKANPIGLIVLAVIALIGTFVALYKNWDVVKVKLIKGAEAVRYGLAIAWEYIKIGFFNLVKFKMKLIGTMYKPWFLAIDQVIKAFNRITGKELPTLSQAFNNFSSFADNTIERSHANIARMQSERARNAAEAARLEAEAKASLAESNASREDDERSHTQMLASENDKRVSNARATARSFKDILQSMVMSEEAAFQVQVGEAQKFFEQRAQLEADAGANKIEWLREQQEIIAEMESLTNEERLAAETALSNAIIAEQKRVMEAKLNFAKESLSAAAGMFDSFQTIAENSGKKSRELAVIQRGIAIAEAGINTALGVTKALSAYPPPFNFGLAGLVGAAGAAQIGAIASTPIPSAQTGGRFTVPDTPETKNDGGLLRVQGGETVDVSPRGESLDKTLNVIVNVEEDTIFRIMQKGIDTGNVVVSNRNIGRSVFA